LTSDGAEEFMGDPFLNYFALFLLLFVVVVLFYGIIAIHDIPYLIAKQRHHPHQDAIHAAGWVSLFTLHALWPFLWIWAMAYRPERGWGFSHHSPGTADEPAPDAAELEDLRRRVTELESTLKEHGSKSTRHKKDQTKTNNPAAHKLTAGGE
jgi:type VI protein secretion system component VasK